MNLNRESLFISSIRSFFNTFLGTFGICIALFLAVIFFTMFSPSDNIDGFMSSADIDGALVGGASLKADSFARIAGFKEV